MNPSVLSIPKLDIPKSTTLSGLVGVNLVFTPLFINLVFFPGEHKVRPYIPDNRMYYGF
jgi:hypothetical protein